MAERHSCWQHPEACHAAGKLDVATRPSPRQNHLLAALPAREYARLLPALEIVQLPAGWTVHGAGDPERYLHFVTAGLVARLYVTEDGASVAFAVTGSEGVIGVASFLSGESVPSQAVVLIAGHAYRLNAGALRREFEHDGPLPRLLLRYTRALLAHTGMLAVCNRHHSLDQRLCRWILSCADRLPSDELTITQEAIGEMLGVRRVGVTEALGRLQQARRIQCSRGRIVMLDRPGLEAGACECYRVIKGEYDRLPGASHAHSVSDARRGPPRGGEVDRLPARS